MKNIYCFLDGGTPGLLRVVALTDDGKVIECHGSSSKDFARKDIGTFVDGHITGIGIRKREKYLKVFPKGFKAQWFDKPEENEEVMRAVEKNREIGEKS